MEPETIAKIIAGVRNRTCMDAIDTEVFVEFLQASLNAQCIKAYENGYGNGYDDGYDNGYDNGYENCYADCNAKNH